MRIVALDQGTTSTRALLRSERGAEVVHSLRHRQIHPAAGRVEHDPDELLSALRDCLEATGPADAIAIANQGESCLAWDAVTGRPLSPIIVWQDRRTEDICRRLEAEGAAPLVASRAGLPLDPYFSASKLGWLLQNIPDVADARRTGRLRLGTTDAFFLQALTGACSTDVTTASRSSLMSLGAGEWDPELCDLFGVPVECLPPIRPTVSPFGSVDGVPVLASVTDQQAALYGHGCRIAGDTKMTFGTGAFALTLTGGQPLSGQGLLPTVAWQIGDGPMQYALDGGVYDAGSAVEWAMRSGWLRDLSELDRFDAAPAVSRGIVFIPAFSGLACPWWDRSAAPLLIGADAGSGPRDLVQALLEGVAFLSARVVGALQDVGGHGGDRALSIDGGLSRSPGFVQFLADLIGRPVIARGFADLTALGAADMAALGLGQDLPPYQAEDRTYTPRDCPRAEWMARFEAALDRARGWRAP
ncbi:FGGY family carbohydrate kinase [Halodurantibacterium flavum]|uniref:FGGY family carbohydrate kinase n=1 Tax=Halodurantibacterium flavum TaxID=1382802 RepID=A0ABW4S6J7_9RHOB